MIKPPRAASTANPYRKPDGSVLSGLAQECDEGDEHADACDCPPMSRQQVPRHPAAASGAATPGSHPLHTLGSLGPLPFLQYPRWFESAPGVRVVPFFAWSVLGSPPFCAFHHCTGQVATDPQSSKGGSQRACPLGVPTRRLLGVEKEWR